jgi:hypothetical protein
MKAGKRECLVRVAYLKKMGDSRYICRTRVALETEVLVSTVAKNATCKAAIVLGSGSKHAITKG